MLVLLPQILDSRDLTIERVAEESAGTLKFSVAEKNSKFGSAVLITLPQPSAAV